MQLIRHRVNSLLDLNATPPDLGVEIDLRTFSNEIILSHDPFQTGLQLNDFLKSFSSRSSTLILNVKEDSLEEAVCKLCCQFGITNYFFTDLTMPGLVRLTNSGVKNVAVRVSELETSEAALAFSGKASWIWYDCFSGNAPKAEDISKLQKAGFRICLVSPELHGFNAQVVTRFQKEVQWLRPEDAVCTKFPALWGSHH